MAGALLLWIAGRWLINVAVRLISRGMARNQFDPAPMPGYSVSGVWSGPPPDIATH